MALISFQVEQKTGISLIYLLEIEGGMCEWCLKALKEQAKRGCEEVQEKEFF